MRSTLGLNQWRLQCLALAQDLVRRENSPPDCFLILLTLAQLAVLAFEGLHLLGHLAGDTGPLAAVDLGLVDPVIQGLRRAADLG